jgi:hypothetical protein
MQVGPLGIRWKWYVLIIVDTDMSSRCLLVGGVGRVSRSRGRRKNAAVCDDFVVATMCRMGICSIMRGLFRVAICRSHCDEIVMFMCIERRRRMG